MIVKAGDFHFQSSLHAQRTAHVQIRLCPEAMPCGRLSFALKIVSIFPQNTPQINLTVKKSTQISPQSISSLPLSFKALF